MPNENIQHVLDHIRLYRTCHYSIFFAVTKRTTNRDSNKKFKKKTYEKMLLKP